jgi:hypothetical protein
MKTIFDFKTVSDNEPMVHDAFFTYLRENVQPEFWSAKPGRLDTIMSYLEFLGFDKSTQVIKPEKLDTLKTIYSYWANNLPLALHTVSLSDLFTDKGGYTLYINGKKPITVGLTDYLADIMKKSMVLYLDESNYYFSISEAGYLIAKYSHIIGSRKVCKVSGY